MGCRWKDESSHLMREDLEVKFQGKVKLCHVVDPSLAAFCPLPSSPNKGTVAFCDFPPLDKLTQYLITAINKPIYFVKVELVTRRFLAFQSVCPAFVEDEMR